MSQPTPLPWTSAFLAEVDAAWAKRRRAIRNQTRSAATQQIDASEEDEERFVLAFSLRVRQHVTVTVRASRQVTVVAAESIPNGGWAWQFTDAGRLAAGAPALVAAIEETLSACFGMTAERTGRLDAIWRPLLAKGPRAIG